MKHNFGQTFKSIRQFKDITQKDIADHLLALSHLSKFESGETTVNIETFFTLLERLNVSPNEFMYIKNGFRLDQKVYLLKKLMTYNNSHDLDQLIELHSVINKKSKLNRNLDYSLLGYLCELMIAVQTNSYDNNKELHIKRFMNYFTSLNQWTMNDFILFNNVAFIFDVNHLKILFPILQESIEKYKNFTSENREVIYMCLNVSEHFLEHEIYDLAWELIESGKELALKKNLLFELNMCNYISGIIEYIYFNNPNKGMNLIKNSLKVLNLFDFNALSKHLSENLKYYSIEI